MDLVLCLDINCIGVLSKRQGLWYCPACRQIWGRGPEPRAVELSEKDFEQIVLGMARAYGWFVAHFRPAQTAKGWRTPVSADGQGYPDLCLVRDDRIVYVELKSDKGKLTEPQKVWLEMLQGTGKCEVYCWKPSQLDEIETSLNYNRVV